jgi:type II secretory pathway pseudopilin PulG
MAISTRVREESGFGLVELLVAMTVMVVGITALVAGLSSGMVALLRAEQSSTAATVADIQMEAFRKVSFSMITPTCSAPITTPASTDCPFVSSPPVTGPDGRSYRVDHAIRWNCAVGTLDGTVDSPKCTPTEAARPAKLVTLVVYDPSTTPAKELFRETSTFDQATG